MPFYEYGCSQCESIEEIICSIKEREEKIFHCPKCNKPLDKLLSATSIRKGAGLFSIDTGVKDFGNYED